MQPWYQLYTPLGSLWLSAFVAAIPILFFFVALAGLRMKGHAAAAITLVLALGVAIFEYGMPVRLPWANDYRGNAMVLYGHVLVPEAEWINNTMCLETGVVFGGKLTALRYPEKDLVSVKAHEVWNRRAPAKAPKAKKAAA